MSVKRASSTDLDAFDAHVASIERLHKELRKRIEALAEAAVIAAQELRDRKAEIARLRRRTTRRKRPARPARSSRGARQTVTQLPPSRRSKA